MWIGVLVLILVGNAEAQQLRGNIDVAGERVDRHLIGWGLDLDQPTRSSKFEIMGQSYNSETGQWEWKSMLPSTEMFTNVVRPDVNKAFKITGAHGFSVPAPSWMFGRMTHSWLYVQEVTHGEWYQINEKPKITVLRFLGDTRPAITATVKDRRGNLLDSYSDGVRVTIYRIEEDGLYYESGQNHITGNCYVVSGKLSCWEGSDWENGGKLTLGRYRVEVKGNNTQLYTSHEFQYTGANLSLGDITLQPWMEMTVKSTVVLGRTVKLVVEVEHWEEGSIEICGTVRGRVVTSDDGNVSFGCQVATKGRHLYEFEFTVPQEFPEGFWVSYKFTLGPVGDGWRPIGELWDSRRIER